MKLHKHKLLETSTALNSLLFCFYFKQQNSGYLLSSAAINLDDGRVIASRDGVFFILDTKHKQIHATWPVTTRAHNKRTAVILIRLKMKHKLLVECQVNQLPMKHIFLIKVLADFDWHMYFVMYLAVIYTQSMADESCTLIRFIYS